MKTKISLATIQKQAAKRKITVNVASKSITLTAPEGQCFEPGLHALVSSQWDDQSWSDIINQAYHDLETYELELCAPDCECRDNP
jgi:hypothetical protein